MRYVLFGAAVLLLSACMSPEQQRTVAMVLDEMLAAGSITASQHEVLREAILSGGEWWQTPVMVVVSVALSLLGVRSNLPVVGRGAPTQKVGLPAGLVKQ